MPRLHALELVPDAVGDETVRRDWQALSDAGLPSMLDHTGAGNTPHVTLVAHPAIHPGLEARACALVGPLLPLPVRASGPALLGGEKVTVARLLDVPAELTRAVVDLRRGAPEERQPGWLPHVTLGRRVPRAEAQRAVDAVGHADVVLTLTALRRWDPERREVRLLRG
ncbi:MAG TPA: 2'-5' RNA ligase family protein [Nocardioides sp.]|jgi:2'-5' RNA ligase superfamily protein|nr:2'-5' RNA ligase family protein [Nocardioides sp.]